MTKEECTACLSLKSNNDVIIQKAEKGNTVVIVDRVSYVFEMEKLLGDTSKFIKVAFNPKRKVNKEVRHLTDIESKIKHCLGDLPENNYLSKENYNYMRPCSRKLAVLYGLWKFHKKSDEPNKLPPLHPILSAIGTCSYNLANFFVPILK